MRVLIFLSLFIWLDLALAVHSYGEAIKGHILGQTRRHYLTTVATSPDETKIADAVTKASRQLADLKKKGRINFGANGNPDNFDFDKLDAPKGNWRKYWGEPESGTYFLKKGVKASEAIGYFFSEAFEKDDSGESFHFECLSAMHLAFHKAALDLLGAERFDRLIGTTLSLGIGTGANRSPLIDRFYKKNDVNEFIRGHWYYFDNPDVTPEERVRGWQGQNAIYLGDNSFYTTGTETPQQILSKLQNAAKEGGRMPYLKRASISLDPDLLNLR